MASSDAAATGVEAPAASAVSAQEHAAGVNLMDLHTPLALTKPSCHRCGFLRKRGQYGIAAKWKERFLVLKGSKLWYYPKSAELTDMPKGVIDLLGAGVSVLEGHFTGVPFCLAVKVQGSGRVYYVRADSEEETRSWESSIRQYASLATSPDLVSAAAADGGGTPDEDEAMLVAMQMSLVAGGFVDPEDMPVPERPEGMSEDDYAAVISAMRGEATAAASAARPQQSPSVVEAPTVRATALPSEGKAGAESETEQAHSAPVSPSDSSAGEAGTVAAVLPPPPAEPDTPPPGPTVQPAKAAPTPRALRDEEEIEGVLSEAVMPAEGGSIVRSGWLQKRSEQGVFNNWRRRWVVLRGWHLAYYTSQGASQPKGVIALEGAGIATLSDKFRGKPTVLAISTRSGRRFYLHGTSSDDALAWLESIKGAAPVTLGDPLHIQDASFWGSVEAPGRWAFPADEDGASSDEESQWARRAATPPGVAAYREYVAAREAAAARVRPLPPPGGLLATSRTRRPSATALSSPAPSSLQDVISLLVSVEEEPSEATSPARAVHKAAETAALAQALMHLPSSERQRLVDVALRSTAADEAGASPSTGLLSSPSPAVQASDEGEGEEEHDVGRYLAALSASAAELKSLQQDFGKQVRRAAAADAALAAARADAAAAAAQVSSLRAAAQGSAAQQCKLQVAIASLRAQNAALQNAVTSLLSGKALEEEDGGEGGEAVSGGLGVGPATALQAQAIALAGERDAYMSECLDLKAQFAQQLEAWRSHLADAHAECEGLRSELAASRAAEAAWARGEVAAEVQAAYRSGMREGVLQQACALHPDLQPATADTAQAWRVGGVTAAVAAVHSHEASWPTVLDSVVQRAAEAGAGDDDALVEFHDELGQAIALDIAALAQGAGVAEVAKGACETSQGADGETSQVANGETSQGADEESCRGPDGETSQGADGETSQGTDEEASSERGSGEEGGGGSQGAQGDDEAPEAASEGTLSVRTPSSDSEGSASGSEDEGTSAGGSPSGQPAAQATSGSPDGQPGAAAGAESDAAAQLASIREAIAALETEVASRNGRQEVDGPSGVDSSGLAGVRTQIARLEAVLAASSK